MLWHAVACPRAARGPVAHLCAPNRFNDRAAISRMIRWTAFRDRAAARRSVDEVLARPFDRLVPGHGAPIVDGAREALASAYTWLR